MKKKITIEVPNGWNDVTLKKYLALHADMDNYKANEEAQTALLLHHLCNLSPDYLKGLGTESYNKLRNELLNFSKPEELELQRFIFIDGIEYGFEPNLSNITYGAYADITQYDAVTIDKNWAKVMSILYRPVIKKIGDMYEIETYTGKIDEEMWLKQTMDKHFGALFFFVNLSMDLLKDTLKSLTQTTEIPANIKSVLVKSGEHMQQSLNLPTETLKRLMELSESR
jgi:hypothetical protein